ncbi:MAG: phosphate acyltransferase [Coxiella sp. DG_40]|nr:MAG: phosphate acyltransferase [Coxiella sp. DG_40]
MNNVTIAIDAMGGDYGVTVTVPAALSILKKYTNVQLILVGDEKQIKSQLGFFRRNKRLSIHHASQQVAMDELPSKALRIKKDSSMRIAINLVKTGEAQACVSAGNTGALMVISRFVLKTLPNVDRPAIVTLFPTFNQNKVVRVLDLGANINSCADHLYQFAVMGSALTSALDDIEIPKIGLLNIGEEEIKGNDLVKQAAQLLSESRHINYIGYVEGNDIFKGIVDVVVCDGFVGNVTLKVIEGTAQLIAFYIKQEFKKNRYSHIAALTAYPVLKSLKKTLDPGRYNGASLLGLQGIVIKSHGSANIPSFANAIKEAILEVEKNIPLHISERVGIMLKEAEF